MFGKTYHMNKNLLLPALLILTFAACKKSNSSKPQQDDNSTKLKIVGKWSYTSDTIKMYVDDKLTETYPTGGVNSSYYEQFNSDGAGLSGKTGESPVGSAYNDRLPRREPE